MSPDFAGGGAPRVLFGLAGADGVWGPRRFALFWTGDTLSALGSAHAVAAVPFQAYSVLHASPGEMGVIKAAQSPLPHFRHSYR